MLNTMARSFYEGCGEPREEACNLSEGTINAAIVDHGLIDKGKEGESQYGIDASMHKVMC